MARTGDALLVRWRHGVTMLRCDECGAGADDEARGWQAMFVDDGYEPCPFVVVFCPRCVAPDFPDEGGVSHAEA